MTVFIILAALMFGVSFYLIVRPLSGNKSAAGKVSRKVYNQAVYNDRLAELENEKEAQGLSDAEFDTLKLQLQQSLLEDIPEERSVQSVESIQTPKAFYAAVVFVLVASVSSYAVVGSYKEVEQWQAIKSNPELSEKSLKQILVQPKENDPYKASDYLLAQRSRVAESPDDASQWLLLGKAYAAIGYKEGASQVAEKVERLSLDSTEDHIQLAQLFQVIDGNGRRAQPVLSEALKQEPKNPTTLVMLADLAQRNEEYKAANQYWKTLNETLPSEAPIKQTVEKQIEENEKLQLAKGPSNEAGGKRKIHIKVRLDERFKGKYSPSDTLFVYAKMAHSGAPMPLAVKKLTAADLGVTVTLDETMAMMPQMSLAKFNEVKVFARISKSGDAMARTGDLEGTSGVLTIKDGDNHAEVMINQVVGHGSESKTGSEKAVKYHDKPEAKKATSQKPVIKVNVTLSPSMKNNVSDGDKVFIFAKAKKGPKMPLAVKTARVKDLPVTVSLTDDDAMTPAMKLSSVSDVIVTARVSKTGNAIAQSGDLEGKPVSVELLNQKGTVKIEIDHILP